MSGLSGTSSFHHADSSLTSSRSSGCGSSIVASPRNNTTNNATSKRRRTSIRIDAIKLNFEKELCCGREAELETIRKIYRGIMKEDTTTPSAFCGELIVLHGKAGAGKTAIVEHLFRDEERYVHHDDDDNNDERVLYARAKFDAPNATGVSISSSTATTPPTTSSSSSSSANLDPIARACGDLCDSMSTSPDRDIFRERIVESLGLGLEAFVQFVPPAANFLLHTSTSTTTPNNNNNNNNNEDDGMEKSSSSQQQHHKKKDNKVVVMIREERAFERLKILVNLFLYAVCGNQQQSEQQQRRTCVVLFLDDLQWADEGCMELLRFLAAGKQKGLLLIVSHRDEEWDHESHLAQQLHRLEKDMHVTRIHVPELDEAGVNRIISNLTEESMEDTKPLAQVVYQKTHGNAFFVTQFLRSIEEEGYLYYSARSMRWKWDLDSIESQTHISDNVVEFVTHKIQRLPASSQAALTLAACLGSTIHTKIIDYLATKTNLVSDRTATDDDDDDYTNDETQNRTEQEWMEIFDSLAQEGLVNKRQRGSRAYVWSHDRILESAYRLVPSGDDQKRIHLQIGEALNQLVDCPLGENWKIITATDQLNRASSIITDKSKRVDLAQMNLTAAKTVASISAFYQAAKYLRAGVELLEESSMWSSHYELSLELHNYLAEMEKYVGHHEACRLAANEVLKHGRNLNDQFRSYMVLIDSLGSKGEFDELMKYVLDLTRRLGEPLPARQPSKLRLLLEILRTNRMIGKRTDEELLQLPAITDERVLQLLSLFSRLHRLTWYAGKIPLTIFIRLRMTQLFVKHGCSEYTGPALALYGSILARMGKLDEAFRFGMLALKLCERFPIEETQTSIYVFVHLKIIKKPLSHSIEPLLRAHRAGLEKGDSIVSGGLAYTVFYFYQGLPLGPMQEDARSFAIHMAQSGNEAFSTFVNFFRQLALNFMGRSENFLVLSGEAIDLEKIERQATEQKNHVMLLFSWTSQLLLACFSGDQALSISMFEKLENADLLPEFFPGPAILGLVSAFLARSTGSRKYTRKAIKVMKQLNGLLKKGSVNFFFYLLLIKAELAAVQKKEALATKMFEAAMRAASQSGLTNFGALAAERYGLFALERDRSDTFWAETHLSRAVFLYSEWGAQAKVDSMKRNYPLLTSETRINSRRTTHHLGRRRLDVKDLHMDSFRQVEMRFRYSEGGVDSSLLDLTEPATEKSESGLLLKEMK